MCVVISSFIHTLVSVHRVCSVVVGPLLYHFADMSNESSVELSYEEVRKIITKFNFDIVVSVAFMFHYWHIHVLVTRISF